MPAEKAQQSRVSRTQRENRGAILDAALEVFSLHGFRGATLDQIASEAGLSKPNILYYFEGKEAIFVTLLDQLMDSWLEPLRQIDPEGEPLAEIRAYVRRKVQMSAEMPRESRLFAGEIVQGAPRFGDHLAAQLKALFDETCELLARWMDEGRLAPVDPRHLLFSIWATTQTYADFEAQIGLLTGARPETIEDAAAFLDTLYVRLLTP